MLARGSVSASSEHAYPSKKSLVEGSRSVVASSVPLTESVAQRVTRLLSPNFKLTMTDTMPSVLHSRNFSSLLIGNVGSATMRTALTSTRVFPHPVTVRSRAVVARKYPNISLGVIPTGHPLLDHDYCYQNYYELVQAATKQVKEENAKKKAFAKQELKLGVDDVQPVKRKYRTKRVIAEEMKAEADKRAALKQKVLEGDVVAQRELDALDNLELERGSQANKKRGSKKRRESTATVEPDSEDELNEMTEIPDTKVSAGDRGPTIKDQFVYYGSKRYQTRRKQLEKEKDPYELFWTTGQLKPSKSQSQLNTNQDQEINDVLDVLGISPCESEVSDVLASTWPDTPRPSECGDDDSTNSSTGTPSSGALDGGSCHVQKNSDALTDEQRQKASEKGFARAGLHMPVGLDDLLQGITMDQMSELIHTLNSESSLDSVGVKSEPVCVTESSVETSQLQGCEIPSLAILAKNTCADNNIEVPIEVDTDNICLSQQSQASNISLDFSDADLLASDKNIDLDLLNHLSSTPPRMSRPSSLFLTPTSIPGSPRILSMASPMSSPENSSESTTRSPMVVPVTMYWNTFPALLLDGVKYVRLIDISRQALPSKETGLLKKRAQSLGYEVINCSDLQRSLLVKYAFACPSRSNLMVSEAGAAEVIASYMEKSEIEELSKAIDVPSQHVPAGGFSTKPARAPAEPVTLMPEVLIEHQPLQKTSSGGSKTTPTTTATEPLAPERSSRLRQIKKSYRRFLPRSTSTVSGATTTKVETGTCAALEESASDRGYHSDQSPDGFVDKPVQTKKCKTQGAAKQGKSARRSLSTANAAETVDVLCANSKPSLEISASPPAQSPPAQLAGEMVPEGAPPTVTVDVPPLSPSPSASSVCELSPGIKPLEDNSALHSQLENTVAEPVLNVMTKSEIVHIRHVDFVAKRNGKRNFQDGDLYLQFFKSLHSPCIQCCTCRQFYTHRLFCKHQHSNRKLAAVKIRQRIEPRGLSVDSELWQLFQKKKHLLEANRVPLKKLNDSRLSKPSAEHEHLASSPPKLGKRIPKQKKCSPDEVYYSNPCIRNTSRKRQAEANLNVDTKRSCLDTRIDRRV